jgi:hypothetical protein
MNFIPTKWLKLMTPRKTDKQRIQELEDALWNALRIAAEHLPYKRDTVGYDDFRKIYKRSYGVLYGLSPSDTDINLNELVAAKTPVGRRLKTTQASWFEP